MKAGTERNSFVKCPEWVVNFLKSCRKIQKTRTIVFSTVKESHNSSQFFSGSPHSDMSPSQRVNESFKQVTGGQKQNPDHTQNLQILKETNENEASKSETWKSVVSKSEVSQSEVSQSEATKHKKKDSYQDKYWDAQITKEVKVDTNFKSFCCNTNGCYENAETKKRDDNENKKGNDYENKKRHDNESKKRDDNEEECIHENENKEHPSCIYCDTMGASACDTCEICLSCESKFDLAVTLAL